MNKTIFKLDHKISVIILSCLAIILSFLSNTFYINGFMGYLFYLFRGILFIGIFGVLYMIEKNNTFKNILKRFIGYFCILEISNTVFALFVIAHLLSNLFLTLSAIVCLFIIIISIFEIIDSYSNNKTIHKILAIVDKFSSLFYTPLIKLISSR